MGPTKCALRSPRDDASQVGNRYEATRRSRRPTPGLFTWSPDSESLAFCCDGKLVVADRKTLKVREIADCTGSRPAWSPDGKWIACGENGLLKLVASDGGERREMKCDGFDGNNICWGADSQELAVILDGRLSIVSLSGDILDQYDSASEVYSWSSDGKHIAYERDSAGQRQVWILSLSDGESHMVDVYRDCVGGVWAPHSNLLAFWCGGKLMVVGPDGKNPKIFGDSFRGSTMPPSWLKVRNDK